MRVISFVCKAVGLLFFFIVMVVFATIGALGTLIGLSLVLGGSMMAGTFTDSCDKVAANSKKRAGTNESAKT